MAHCQGLLASLRARSKRHEIFSPGSREAPKRFMSQNVSVSPPWTHSTLLHQRSNVTPQIYLWTMSTPTTFWRLAGVSYVQVSLVMRFWSGWCVVGPPCGAAAMGAFDKKRAEFSWEGPVFFCGGVLVICLIYGRSSWKCAVVFIKRDCIVGDRMLILGTCSFLGE